MKSIFVGGYSRTGTTLMQGIICSDPAAFDVTREASFLRSLLAAFEYGKRMWDEHTNDFFPKIEQLYSFNKTVLDMYFNQVRKIWGEDKIIVQKEPRMTKYFCEVFELEPESLFVVMTRDPRDAVASQVQRQINNFGDKYKRDAMKFFYEYISFYDRLIQNRKIFGDRLMFVQYEKLLREPKQTLEKLREFTGLELPIDPTRDKWTCRRGPNFASPSPLDGKPISTEPIGRHKKVLTEKEISEIMKFKDHLNSEFGFDLFLAE